MRMGQERAGHFRRGSTDLAGIHLELAHHLDGDLALLLAGGVARAVHVAEGAVAHFFEQSPALEPGVLGKLALCFTLLGHDTL